MGEGRGEGVVTAPINKEAIHKAGIPFIGHTEIFQELTHSEEALTMFQVKSLRVFFLYPSSSSQNSNRASQKR